MISRIQTEGLISMIKKTILFLLEILLKKRLSFKNKRKKVFRIIIKSLQKKQ